MAKEVAVLLLEDVAALGKAGDIVTVSEGYARNFLFPGALGALADADVQSKHAKKVKKAQKNEAEHTAQLQEQASKLDGTELTIAAPVKDGEEIFGSITKQHIASRLEAAAGINISPRSVVLTDPLKSLGSFEVEIQLSKEVTFMLMVTVVPEADDKENQSDDE